MLVEVGIVFSKSTYMKNKILSRTYSDMKEDYLVIFILILVLVVKSERSFK